MTLEEQAIAATMRAGELAGSSRADYLQTAIRKLSEAYIAEMYEMGNSRNASAGALNDTIHEAKHAVKEY